MQNRRRNAPPRSSRTSPSLPSSPRHKASAIAVTDNYPKEAQNSRMPDLRPIDAPHAPSRFTHSPKPRRIPTVNSRLFRPFSIAKPHNILGLKPGKHPTGSALWGVTRKITPPPHPPFFFFFSSPLLRTFARTHSARSQEPPLRMTLDHALGQRRARAIKLTRTNRIFKARQRRLGSHIERCV